MVADKRRRLSFPCLSKKHVKTAALNESVKSDCFRRHERQREGMRRRRRLAGWPLSKRRKKPSIYSIAKNAVYITDQ
jgi:hypothetical protein